MSAYRDLYETLARTPMLRKSMVRKVSDQKRVTSALSEYERLLRGAGAHLKESAPGEDLNLVKTYIVTILEADNPEITKLYTPTKEKSIWTIDMLSLRVINLWKDNK